MDLFDTKWLMDMGEFCVTYGGWAAFLIILVLYVGQLRALSKWRREANSTFQKYHVELVHISEKYASGQVKETNAINDVYRVIKAAKEANQKLLDFVVQYPGIIKIQKMSKDETVILKNFLNNGEGNDHV